MRHCPVCQASYEDDARFCPDDGAPLKDSPDPYIGKVFLGQFEIREICGRGSMGTVYRAWQRSMDREVAIKVLRRDLLRDPRIVKRFRREARASARLSHPSIITVYVVGDTDDGVPFIAMEFVKGRSLDEVLAERGRLPLLQTIHIVRQICSALAEAHGQHIVHRDLKPENIFLCSTSHTPDFVKILDFGIAKILYANEESLLTQTGAIFGTPYYLSPEQASGAEVDHRCDLYALGVILYRMLTGRLPFDKPSGVAVLIQHLREAPPRPRELCPDLPEPVEHVMLKALEKSPASRWQSAQELSGALETIQSYLATSRPQGAALAAVARPLAATVSDQEGGLVAPTLAAEPAREPREREALPQAPESTLGLARRVTGRRRLLMHILFGLGSVASGSALGAVLYWRRDKLPHLAATEPALPEPVPASRPPVIRDAALRPSAVDSAAAASGNQNPPSRPPRTPHAVHHPAHPPAPPSSPVSAPPASQPATSQPAGPASAPAPASEPAPTPRRPRRPSRRSSPLAPAPVGPDPSVDGDHGRTAPSPPVRPAPDKKDEPYDLVE